MLGRMATSSSTVPSRWQPRPGTKSLTWGGQRACDLRCLVPFYLLHTTWNKICLIEMTLEGRGK